MASNQIERSPDREIKSSQFLNSSLSHSRAILPHEFSTISRRNQLFRSIIVYQIERSPCSDFEQHFDPTACLASRLPNRSFHESLHCQNSTITTAIRFAMATTQNPASSTPRSSPNQKNQLFSPCRRCGTSFATKKLLFDHVKAKPRCTKDKAYIQRCRQAKEMEHTQESHQQLPLEQPQPLQKFGGASIPSSSANFAMPFSSATNRLSRSRFESRPRSRSDSSSSSSTSSSTSSSGGIPIDSPRSTSQDGHREESHQEEHQDQEELYKHEYGDQDHYNEHDNTSESDFSDDSYSFDSDSDY